MSTKVIPLSDLGKKAETYLKECARSGKPLIVELPDHVQLLVQRRPTNDDDNLVNRLISGNREFREMLAKSAKSGTRPFVRKTKRHS